MMLLALSSRMWYIALLAYALPLTRAENTLYQNVIESDGHLVEGKLYPDAVYNDKVPSDINVYGHLNQHLPKYLRILWKEASRAKNSTHLLVMNTEAFHIDQNGYLTLRNLSLFDEENPVSLYVVVMDDLSGQVISNPVPFIIRLAESAPKTKIPHYSNEAAIFAGVLILVIVFFALLIPFVVRAKRRLRSGKPVMKLGSFSGNEEALERRRSAEFLDLPRTASEPNWYGTNTVLDYRTEVKREQEHFTEDIKQMDEEQSKYTKATFVIGETIPGRGPIKKGILRNGDRHLSSKSSNEIQEETSKL